MGKRSSKLGLRFGRLLVIDEYRKDNGNWMCICKCDCGNFINVLPGNLGKCTNSCGCLKRELSASRNHLLYTVHGLEGTRIYNIFHLMKSRCNNHNDKSYKHYGGRGIKCLWKDFATFKKDMYASYLDHVEKYGEKDTSIDRIDVNGNYCKENCKWSTWNEQNSNTTRNHYVIFNGDRFTITNLARHLGMSYNRLYYPLINGTDIKITDKRKVGIIWDEKLGRKIHLHL